MIDADPDLVAGRRFHDAGRWDLAERHLRAGLARQPLSAEDHAFLARALIHLDRRWDARQESDESLRLAPNSHEVLAARIDVLDGVGDHGGAVRTANDLVRLMPGSAAARSALAFALLRNRRPRAALETADEALAIDPDDVGALNARALALGALGRPDEAELTLREALRHNPQSAGLHNNIGLMQMRQGQIAVARGSMLESLRIDPMSRLAATNLRWSRNPILRELMVILGGFGRGLRRWGRWPVGVQVGLILGLMLGGLAWSGAPAAGILVLLWSVTGWIRRAAPDLSLRVGRTLERIPFGMMSLPFLGTFYVLKLIQFGGPIAGVGAVLGFLLPLVLGMPTRSDLDATAVDAIGRHAPGGGDGAPADGAPADARRVNVVGGGVTVLAGGLAIVGTLLPWIQFGGPNLPADTVHGLDGSRGQTIAIVAMVAIVVGLARIPSTGPAGWRRGLSIVAGFVMVAASAPIVVLVIERAPTIAPPYSAALGPGLPIAVVAGLLAVVGSLIGGGGVPVVRAPNVLKPAARIEPA